MDSATKYSAADIINLIRRNELTLERNRKNIKIFKDKRTDAEWKALKSKYNKDYIDNKKMKKREISQNKDV